ncbi:MAG: cbhB, partial [Phycisphaerales bacterium]|nr:cbhB [Phycisphaerales bacterium]
PQSGSPQIAYLDRAGGSVQLAKAQGGGWSSVNLGTGDSVVVARDPLTNSFSVLFTGGSGASVGPSLSDPSNLMANVLSNSEIDLNWTDNSTIETAFVIERSADGGATFASLAQVGANVTTYSDISAGDGQSYIYRVKAMDGTGSSHFSLSQPVTTTLNAPTGLQATANSDGSVHLSWQDQSAGVTGFRIEISPDGIGFADTGLTPASVEQFDDGNAGLDRAWYYRVVPFSALGDGPATPALLVHTAPAAPQHMRIYGEGPTMFQLEWDPIGGSATDLLLQVRLAGTTDAFRTLATIGADQISHIVTQDADGNALATDTAYEFRLVARNVDGIASSDSNHATGSTGLIAPENVVAQALSATSASLTWEPNSGSATNYNVYLSTDGNTFALYSATFLQASTLLLPNLSPQTHYWLKVAATDGSQESAGVVVQVDTLPGAPGAAPVNVTAQVSFDNPLWLNVSWSNAASDATGFHVQRCTDDVHFVTIEDVPVTWANYDDPSVVEGTYYYRIVPFGPGGDGTPSVATFATASLANPINLKAVVSTSGTVNLTWTNVSTLATGYQLFAAGDDEIPILVDGAVSPAATNYAVTHFADGTPLTSGAAYSFYLVLTGDVGTMGSSQWARAVNGFTAPPEVDVTPTADGQMTIDWTDVGDEIGYQIESSTDGVQYTFVASVGTDVTHYVQTDLSETARVYYRVKALGIGGDSAYTASSATNVSPNAPTNLVVTPLAGGSFHLTWDDNSSNEDGYAVRFITPNGDTLIPAQLAANATSCTITQADLGGLAMPGHGFTFQVVGFRWLSSTTQPAEVDNVQALA